MLLCRYDDPVLSADQIMFAHVVDRSDDNIELDVAALLIGETETQNLDIGHYLSLLDEFAGIAKRGVEKASGESFASIRALNRALFGELGFRGNEDNYYDPRNSFLHDVIDRRIGVPISLSVVYMEVARRIGVHVDGICFPGHFLVRHDQGDTCLILDPFHMGLILDPEQLRERLRRAVGWNATLSPDMFEPAGKRQILTRMLGNLVDIYQRQGDLHRSIAMLERMRILDPNDSVAERELEKSLIRVGELN